MKVCIVKKKKKYGGEVGAYCSTSAHVLASLSLAERTHTDRVNQIDEK